ncbi:hypothetical protein HK104_000003 [Borealophlyctis nickersoniae]|nr:hypothetical protein HK104_000003 [Borealophlyctis nickersoniae]
MGTRWSFRALLILLLGVALAAAQNASDAFSGNTVDSGRHIIAQTAVFGVIAIVAGFFFLFFGHRLFKPTLFLAGFYFFGCIGYVILINAEPYAAYSNRETVLLVGSIAFGVVGGLLAICVWKVALAFLGALGGFFFALFILSWKEGGAINPPYGRAIFIIIMCVIGVIAIFILQKPVIIVCTSIIGAYSIVMGIDAFAQTGFAASANDFLTSSSKRSFHTFETNGKVYGLLITMIVLAVIGILAQFKINVGRSFAGGKDY